MSNIDLKLPAGFMEAQMRMFRCHFDVRCKMTVLHNRTRRAELLPNGLAPALVAFIIEANRGNNPPSSVIHHVKFHRFPR